MEISSFFYPAFRMKRQAKSLSGRITASACLHDADGSLCSFFQQREMKEPPLFEGWLYWQGRRQQAVIGHFLFWMTERMICIIVGI